MKNFNLLLSNFISDESGQDLIEYALVASVIALGAVASMRTFATAIGTALSTITSTLNADIPTS